MMEYQDSADGDHASDELHEGPRVTTLERQNAALEAVLKHFPQARWLQCQRRMELTPSKYITRNGQGVWTVDEARPGMTWGNDSLSAAHRAADILNGAPE